MCRNLIAVVVLAATTFVAKVPSSQPAVASAGLSIRVAVPENSTVPVGGGHPVVGAVSLPASDLEKARGYALEMIAELQR